MTENNENLHNEPNDILSPQSAVQTDGAPLATDASAAAALPNGKRTRGVVDLTTGNPLKKIILFCLPLMLGHLFQLMYTWSDAIIIGNVKKDLSMFASLSAASPIINLLLTAVMGFMAGAAVIVGQYFGKRKFDDLKKCYATLLVSLFVLGLVFSILGIALAEPLLRLIRVEESLIKNAVIYLRWYFGGTLLMIGYNILAQVLRSLGNSLLPLIVLIVCVMLNVVLNYLFTITLDMGIAGVAIGTLIAQAVSIIILFVYIQKNMPLLRLGIKDVRFDGAIFRQILIVALPSTIQNICACVGFMIINSLINRNGGEYTAAFGVAARIDELFNQIFTGFGAATTAYVAQNKGSGEIARIKSGFWSILLLVSVLTALCVAIVFLFRGALIRLFINFDGAEAAQGTTTLDYAEVVRIVNHILNIYVPSFAFLLVMTITSCFLRGSGDAALAMGINLFSLVLRVGTALIFAYGNISAYLTTNGVLWASPIGWIAGTAWGLVAYFSGHWKKDFVFKKGVN